MFCSCPHRLRWFLNSYYCWVVAIRTEGNKAQTIAVLAILTVLLLGYSGILPDEWFLVLFAGTFVGVIAYIIMSFMYPFLKVAGKHLIAVSFYKNSSETEWAFGKIVESEGGILFRECPGGDKTTICAEIEPIRFVSTRVPFRMLVLKFPEEVNPAALFDNDYITPDSGFGQIPVNVAYLSGVQVGEMIVSRNTAFKPLKDRIMEALGKKVERAERAPIVYVTRNKVRNSRVAEAFRKAFGGRPVNTSSPEEGLEDGEGVDEGDNLDDAGEGDEGKAPIVLVTGYKTADINVLNRIAGELKRISGHQESRTSGKAWVTELGNVRVISTELEELRAENMKLRQVIRGLERVYQAPPTVTTTTFSLEEAESTRDKVLKAAGWVAGAAVVAFLLLVALGVVNLG